MTHEEVKLIDQVLNHAFEFLGYYPEDDLDMMNRCRKYVLHQLEER